MREKKRLILNILVCAVKLAKLRIPYESIQTLCDVGIDAFAELFMDIPEGMPTLEKTLSEYNDVIIYAVKDLFFKSDIIVDESNVFTFSAEKLADIIMKNNNALRLHEEKDANLARVALIQYLQELQLWAVQQPQRLVSSLNSFGVKICEIEKNVKCHERRIAKLEENADSVLYTRALPDISSYDLYRKEKNQFYRYFKADKSISVDQFFWCTNYKLRIMDSDTNNLHDCLNAPGVDLEMEAIIQLVCSTPLVFVTGLYGTGKTALLKRIHYELAHNLNEPVIYLQAKDVLRIMEKIGFTVSGNRKSHFNADDMDEAFLRILNKSTSVYVLIDELDELNIKYGNESYLDIFSLWLSEFLSKYDQFQFVICARKYAQIDSKKEECIADLLYCACELSCQLPLNIICTEHFSPETRDAWIAEYAEQNNKPASYTKIKDDYGKIASALTSPIFLYAFMKKYLSGQCDPETTGYYYYYSQFIDKTVGGKYELKNAATDTVGLTTDQYHALLKKLAYRILHYSEDYLTQNIQEKSFSDEQLLLGDELTKRKFEIPLAQLNDSDITLDDRKHETASSINCFFLSTDRHRVYFTDTNILFSLASEYVFECIENIVKDGNTEFQLDHLMQIEIFHLYPHLVDYIVYLAKHSRYADELYSYVYSFITNPKVKAHMVDLSVNNNIEKILLLYIIFLKTNQHSYNTPDYQHIIKEIVYYVNAYKTNYRINRQTKPYAIERYFMKLRLHHIVLRRINLKNYNFQGSEITDKSSFCQCKFERTNMQNVVMDDCLFSLCQFQKVKEMTLKRKVTRVSDYQAMFDTCNISETEMDVEAVLFRNCKIDNLVLTIRGQQKVKFVNCFIKKITVKPQSGKSTGMPRFEHCIMENKPSIDVYDRSDVDTMLSEGKNIIFGK